jgi:hypothetical protein
VDVAAGISAASAFLGWRTLRLDRCSRWPERQDCGQACLKQITADPENCHLWNIVSTWYLGRSCVCCHNRLGALHRLDHPPALMREDHTTIEWDQIRPEQLPEIFSTSKPLCWNCHIAATYRRVHPELVVDRKRKFCCMMWRDSHSAMVPCSELWRRGFTRVLPLEPANSLTQPVRKFVRWGSPVPPRSDVLVLLSNSATVKARKFRRGKL